MPLKEPKIDAFKGTLMKAPERSERGQDGPGSSLAWIPQSSSWVQAWNTLRAHVPKSYIYIYIGLKVVPIYVLSAKYILFWYMDPYTLYTRKNHKKDP